MQRSLIGFTLVFALALVLIPYQAPTHLHTATLYGSTLAPLPPDAGETAVTPTETPAPLPTPAQSPVVPAVSTPAPKPAPATPDYPVRLSIPSVKLSSAIVKVGTNVKGEMDVPSGKTKNVGWYAAGTMPGDIGSAVIGAHVFAAFANLHLVKPGTDIYVMSRDGKQLHFVVDAVKTYKLEDMSANDLFNRNDGRHLHLITCAGSVTPDGSTYSHRLVVYATLAE
jgi:sortase (surface protein transpeptidase)